jgi:NADH-quinone oxidoreductase subunit G
VVEIEGRDRLEASCNNNVEPGMVVHTRSQKVLDAVTVNLDLILANHRDECTSCVRNTNCSLQTLANSLDITTNPYRKRFARKPWAEQLILQRDSTKCIKCLRCVAVCSKIQGCDVWDIAGTGSRVDVAVAAGKQLEQANCSLCGQCITHCPVGALSARIDIDEVRAALADPQVVTIIQAAPATRSAWGEDLGLSPDEATVGKFVTALRLLGFDHVFDTDTAADLTIIEEAHEFLERFTHRDDYVWPMFTSCCPGWLRFVKQQYPQFLPNLSSAKSPHQMFGTILKSYYAEKLGVDPAKIFVVSLMPCVAKKYEAAVPEVNDAAPGVRDVDAVLTVREFASMVKQQAIDVDGLVESDWDDPWGAASGAAVIFGASGGVMEAALRSAHYYLTGENPQPEVFKAATVPDDDKPWAAKTIEVCGTQVRVAVASGLHNTAELLEAIKAGQLEADFIEVMACPGGCTGGGGQPIRIDQELAVERGRMLSALDKDAPLRLSHENESLKKLYADYLGEPLGHKAHTLLHTTQAKWSI